MDLINFIEELKEKGIFCSVVGTDLKILFDGDTLDQNVLLRIKENKQQLIDFLTKYKSEEAIDEFIPVVSQTLNNYPVSYSQKRIWGMSQIKEGSIAYNVANHLVLEGSYDVQVFERAIRSVIERHEILRTTFKEDKNGDVGQIVIPKDEIIFTLDYKDYKDYRNQNEGNEIALLFVNEDSSVPFDLEHGPLLRASLLQIGDDKYIFYLNFHHIIGDILSIKVLSEDIFEMYKAYVSHVKPNLKELRIQYKDFSVWQNNKMESSGFLGHKKYWLNMLSGELKTLSLPSTKLRPKIKTFNGHRLGTYISSDNTERLRLFCKEHVGSVYMGLLTVLKILLYRYTQQTEIIIGTPVAGRQNVDLENQIGIYTNTLVLKNTVSPQDNFVELFKKVKNNSLEAFSHQDYPFDALVDNLDLTIDVSRNPIFDLIYTFENIWDNTNSEKVAKNLMNQVFDSGSGLTRLDLEVVFKETGDCLYLDINYNTDVYDKALIESILINYKQLLSQLLRFPEETIGRIDYLTSNDKAKLLNPTKNIEATQYPKVALIITLFEEQIDKTPDHVAIHIEGREITYKQLDIVTNKFASYLTENHRISQEDFVGIKLVKDEWLIISILAILKCGATFVPFDIDYTEEEINWIEEQINYSICIDKIVIEKFQNSKETYSSDSYIIEIDPRHLAYVYFSFESSQKPKGTWVEHRSLVDLCIMSKETYGITDSSRSLLFYVSGFDVLALELFPFLTSGAMLFSLSDHKTAVADSWIESINKHQLTHVNIPSLLYNPICDRAFKIESNVKLLVGSEPLIKIRKHKNIDSYNYYNSAENTLPSAHFEASGDFFLGKAIDNTQIYILDANSQLCPQGVIGEICIGGKSLTRASLDNKDFISNPFLDGEFIYRTGDLGKWYSDGYFEYIGKIEDQIRIRGNQVELRKIEAVIFKNKMIEQAIVLCRDYSSQSAELVAYYKPSNEHIELDLKAFLKSRLPNFMIPVHAIQLEEFPMTSIGKIDKRHLLSLSDFEKSNEDIHVVPTTHLEKQLVEIWTKVFGKKDIGITDDFFVLGGHSLKAIQLVSEYHKSFDIKLDLKELFDNTTISGHSKLLESSIKSEYNEIPKLDEAESYPISDAQRRLWILSQFDGEKTAYNIPLSINMNGEYDIENFKKSIHSAIDRYEILRTIFGENVAGVISQFVVPKEKIGFNIECLDYRKELNNKEKVEDFISEDSYKPFDLKNGPLLRATLFQISNNQYVFYFNMHHIISDGLSMEILIQTVLAYYESYEKKEKFHLPNLRIQYKDYASWQLNQLNTEEYEGHKEYWLNNLSGELPILDFPSSKQRPFIKTYEGHVLRTYIPSASLEGLRTFVQENGGSMFIGLLSVWNILCHRYTAQRDIIIGAPVAGRDHKDLEDQIGFYINTLPLRNEINPEENFIDLYTKVKESTLNSYSHQMYPFDRLLGDLELTRDIGRSPVFDVIFTLNKDEEGRNGYEFEDGIVDQIINLGSTVSKYDLEVTFSDTGNNLYFDINYNNDVYDKSMVEDLLKHFKRLLSAVLTNPHLEIGLIDFLTEGERNLLLQDFNATERDYPKDKTIVDLFDEQVAKTPEGIAIKLGNKALSYKELDELSNQFSNYLKKEHKISSEDFVAIKLERSEWLIVSIIAVLKLGSAYIPIDPSYPDKRIKFIENESSCKLCIDIEEIDNFRNVEFSYSKELAPTKIDINSLAYVIYTSGSTGTPKGVMVEHQSLINLCYWHNNEYEVDESSKSTLFSKVGFDASVWEIFPYLLSGATIFPIIHEEIRLSIDQLTSFLINNKITHSFLPTQICKELASKNSNLLDTKILTGGDYLTLSNPTNLTIYNNYGPTENTVVTSSFDLRNEYHGSIPIGKPIHNNKTYILSEKLQLQPVGVEGELYISGASLARGYLNDEALTKQKFIPNPFIPGNQRMYGTGDLARWLPDGNIEFIGRKDNQVQIRGYRIELGEIESVLSQQKYIEQVIVEIREKEENKMLVAYLVVNKPINKQILRVQLSKRLPDYMIPNYFVIIDSIPLTANGKVDRKALPDITENDLIRKKYIEPRNEVEVQVLDIWKRVFVVDKIGVEDNFFELGGNSIMIMELLSIIRERFEIEITPNDLFQYVTIADLASYVSSQIKAADIELDDVEVDIIEI